MNTFATFCTTDMTYTRDSVGHILTFSAVSRVNFVVITLNMYATTGPRRNNLNCVTDVFRLFARTVFGTLLFLKTKYVVRTMRDGRVRAVNNLHGCVPVARVAFLVTYLTVTNVPPFSKFFSGSRVLATYFRCDPIVK